MQGYLVLLPLQYSWVSFCNIFLTSPSRGSTLRKATVINVDSFSLTVDDTLPYSFSACPSPCVQSCVCWASPSLDLAVSVCGQVQLFLSGAPKPQPSALPRWSSGLHSAAHAPEQENKHWKKWHQLYNKRTQCVSSIVPAKLSMAKILKLHSQKW